MVGGAEEVVGRVVKYEAVAASRRVCLCSAPMCLSVCAYEGLCFRRDVT